jgi:predicted DNA binding protein
MGSIFTTKQEQRDDLLFTLDDRILDSKFQIKQINREIEKLQAKFNENPKLNAKSILLKQKEIEDINIYIESLYKHQQTIKEDERIRDMNHAHSVMSAFLPKRPIQSIEKNAHRYETSLARHEVAHETIKKSVITPDISEDDVNEYIKEKQKIDLPVLSDASISNLDERIRLLAEHA